jgi:hypothetical protein
VRRTDMRSLLLFTAIVLTLSAAGCRSATTTAAGAAAPTSNTPVAAQSRAAAPGPGESRTSATGSAPKPSTAPSAPTAGTTGPDNPRDLVGAPVVLTGVISHDNACVLLDTGDRRWALTGTAVSGLAVGQHVTVRGRPVAVPVGCDAAFALALRGTPGK